MDAAAIRATVHVAVEGASAGSSMRAVTAHATPALPATDASAAAALLDATPLRPTGALADALAAGRLLRTGSDDALDRLERQLRHGRIDSSERLRVGSGMNGELFRVRVHDPAAPGSPPMWAVEKDAGAQAAQEEFGWRLARAMGIDYLVAPAIRREDGIARIAFRPGQAATIPGITNAEKLEGALTIPYLDDVQLGLTTAEAGQAARVDRQLLQVFDYLLANNDRHGGNALYDAVTGATTFIDSGHAGRGALGVNGGSTLEPALRMFQSGTAGGRIDLDPEVVEYLRRRLTPETVRSLHAQVFDAPGIAGPDGRSIGAKFITHVKSPTYRDGIVERLDNVLTTGGYTHRAYSGDAGGELPPLMNDMPNVRGFRNVREQFARF